jgi:superfamily II DNA or RNA helicase
LGLRAERSARRNTDTSKNAWEKELRGRKNSFLLEIRDDYTFIVEYPWYPFTYLRGWIPTQRSNYRTENKTSFNLNLYLQGENQTDPESSAYQRRFEHENWVRYQFNAFMKRWEETANYYNSEKAQRTTKFQLKFFHYINEDLQWLRKNGIKVKYTTETAKKLDLLKKKATEDYEIRVFPDNDELVVKWSKGTDQWFRPLILTFIDFLTVIYHETETQKSFLPILTQSGERELRVAYWAIFRAMNFWNSFKKVLDTQKYPQIWLHYEPYQLPTIPWRHINEFIKPKFELRPYQEDALKKWKQHNYFGSEQLPTGSGKTVIGIGAIWETKDRTLILVPNLDLVEQWKDRITTFLNIPSSEIGIFSGNKKDFEKDIVISTYQLLSQYIEDYLVATGELPDSPKILNEFDENIDLSGGEMQQKKYRRSLDVVESAVVYFTTQFGLLLADECHHVQAKTFKEIALNLAIPKRLALSATIEWELNTSLIIATMGPVIYDITYGTLSRTGFIPPILYRKILIPLTTAEKESLLTKKGKSQGFRSKICREAKNKYPMITRIIKAQFTKQILIFTSRIAHAELIYHYLKQQGIESHLLVGTTITNARERESLLQKFREKKVKILILVKMLNEGFDAPADTVIIVSGSKNRREQIQRCGRTTRPGHIAKIFELIVDKEDLDTEYIVAQSREIKNIIEPWIQDKLIGKKLIKEVEQLIRTDIQLNPPIEIIQN